MRTRPVYSAGVGLSEQQETVRKVAYDSFNEWVEGDEHFAQTNLDVAELEMCDQLKNPFKGWWNRIGIACQGESLATMNDNKDPNQYSFKINSNELKMIIDNKLSNFVGQEYSFKVVVRGGFTGTVDNEAVQLNLWANFIQQKVNHFFATQCAKSFLRDALTYDAAFLQITWEKQKLRADTDVDMSDVRIESISPYSIFPSLDGTTLQEHSYIYIIKRTTLTALKLNKTIAINQRFIDLCNQKDYAFDALLDYTLIQDYLFFNPAETIDWDGQKCDFTIKYAKWLDPEDGKKKVRMTYYIGQHFLYKEDIVSDFYPIVALMPSKTTRYFWTMPSMRSLYDQQMLIAKANTMFATQMERFNNPTTIIRASSKISGDNFQRQRKIAGAVLSSASEDITKDIHYVVNPEMPEAFLEAVQTARQNLEYLSGVNRVAMGESVGSINTSRGVNLMIEQANKINIIFQHSLSSAVETLAMLMFSFYEKNVEGITNRSIFNPNPRQEITSVDLSLDPAVLKRYDVDCYLKTQPKNHNDRLTEFSAAMQIIGLQAQGLYKNNGPLITASELITLSPFGAIKDKILTRLALQEHSIQQSKAVEIIQLVKDSLQMQAEGNQQAIPIQKMIDIIVAIENDVIPLPMAQEMAAQEAQQAQAGQGQGQGQQQQGGAPGASAPQNPQQPGNPAGANGQ